MITRSRARLHFLIILVLATVFGADVGRFLLFIGIHNLIWRNFAVMMTSYISFFLLIRVWISYVQKREPLHPEFDRPGIRYQSDDSGHWWDWLVWGDPGFGSADESIFLIIFAIIVIVVLVGFGIWIGVEGPSILIDAAFDASLAAGLIKPSKDFAAGDWHAGVLRRTIIPFSIILVLSSLFMLAASAKCPGQNRLSEIVHQCW